MAGIYLHIPYCKKACNYCNFHFSNSLKMKVDFVDALIHEMEMRKDIFSNVSISSIYFGGGTPSLLSLEELNRIFNSLYTCFNIDKDVEITLEANPDDLNKDKIQQLSITPINRLSIGIQSFSDADLKFMNRSHCSQESLDSIKSCQDIGLTHISIDLIYGTPSMTDEQWLKNLHICFALEVPHISSYILTVEDNTPLHYKILRKKKLPVSESQCIRQFWLLIREMKKANYNQYEISSFCRGNKYSRHNSSYWNKKAYLGFGPSAHSYIGNTRLWNVSNNRKYIEEIKQNILPQQSEVLTSKEQYNEYTMTSLRTIWGCNLNKIQEDFPEAYSKYFIQEIQAHQEKGWVYQSNGIYTLTDTGKLFVDLISSDLFITEEDLGKNKIYRNH